MDMREIQDNNYETIFVSEKQNNSEFDFYYVLSVENMEEIMGEEAPFPYNARILAVSVSENEQVCRNELLQTQGIEFEEATEEEKVVALVEYGVFATLYSEGGKNKAALTEKARKELDLLNTATFGYAMDKRQNAIGSTGWDFIRGDVLAGLSKNRRD